MAKKIIFFSFIVVSILSAFGQYHPRRGMPHDSTIGVGAGFYWFAAAVILFLVLGTLKAFWEDNNWRGRYFNVEEKKKRIVK